MKKSIIAITVAIGASACATASPVEVTVDNYSTVETSRQYEIQIENAGGMNKLDHWYGTTKVDKQPIIRLNQDTVYSMGIVDATKGGSITVPDTDGRFVSVRYIDENHFVYADTYDPGVHKFPDYDGHLYVNVRIGAYEISDKEDKAIAAIQKDIVVSANSNTAFEPIVYDETSLATTHQELLAMFNTGKHDPRKFFALEGVADPIGHHIGTAIGWGGGTAEGTVWNMTPHSKDFTCQSTTFDNPKNKGFWSITVYNEQGFLFAENNVNSYTAIPNDDGTFTVRFGCNGQKNNIQIENESGKWNAIVRSYAPSQMVIDGDWNPLTTIK
jgi:hypothetical protein